MQASETTLDKTFELTNAETMTVHRLNIKLPYLPHTREINIARAVSNIHQSGISLYNSHIFYLDFNQKVYVHLGVFPFQREITLKYELFLDDAIKLRYRRISSQSEAVPAPQPPKKKKVKERMIKEALAYVEQWRRLYDMVDNDGRRIHTSESAAQVVGLAKKTLDDYHYQIRLAKDYGFDFERHRNDKIGVLRNFVRQCIRNRGIIEELPQPPIDDIDRYFAGSSDSDDEYR